MKQLINRENWSNYVKDCVDSGFLEYVNATKHIVDYLETSLQDSKSLNCLKSNLSSFCTERKEFVEYAYDNCP